MSDKNDDLPGFYRDPKTGKYFRDNPAIMKNKSLEKLKKENESESKKSEEPTNFSQYSNIFKFLRAREIGPLSGVNSERDYCKMLVSNKQLINEYDLSTYAPGNINKINYIRGTPSFILGIWTSDKMPQFESSIISHQPLVVDRNLLSHKVYFHRLTDLCEGPNGSIIYICNRTTSKGKIASMVVNLLLQYAYNPVNNRIISEKPYNSPLYCCSSTKDQEHYAVGSHKIILYDNRRTHYSYHYHVFDGARVHTISFNRSSNLMVTGIHNGHVYLWDIRLKKKLTNLNISQYCINESYFLEPHQVIVAGLENVLCKIDLRMNSIVTEYLDHKTSMRKSALSVANNMLCASGADNVTRIWSLSGGSPIHEMNPCISPDNDIKGWLFNSGNKTYLHHFEAGFRKTFCIT